MVKLILIGDSDTERMVEAVVSYDNHLFTIE